MKKLLFILTLILSGLLWYVMVPAALTPSAGRPPLMESFFVSLPRKETAPSPSTLLPCLSYMKDVAKERIDKSDWVSLDNMPAYLPQALIATEDRRFYSHIGIDPSAIMRAVLVNLQYDEVAQGGSTLTQQLVKTISCRRNAPLSESYGKLASPSSSKPGIPKKRFLRCILIQLFGNHSTGIRRAARNYFGIEPKQLSLMECAVLAGLPNAPTDLNPYNDMEACRRRRDLVLENMHDQGFITGNQLNHAKKADIVLR